MKILRGFFFILTIAACITSPQMQHSSHEIIPFETMLDKIADDIQRIEVFYPQQFERLEMNWDENVASYKKQFKQSKTVGEKLNVLARFVNSWHNIHHHPLIVRGLPKPKNSEKVSLPLHFFAEGLTLSTAKFFVFKKSKTASYLKNINIGDEVLSYNGMPVADYLRYVRDESHAENPESVLNTTASHMGYQGYCDWATQNCWEAGDATEIVLQDKFTQQKKNLTLYWQDKTALTFTENHLNPIFKNLEQGWSFTTLLGNYSFQETDDAYHGFLGVLKNDKQKFLVLKQYHFRNIELVQKCIQEANSHSYDGIILDFHENNGGNDSTFALLGGLLGTNYHVELSSMRLVPELLDNTLLQDAAVYSTNTNYFKKLLADKDNWNTMSPFVPFQCWDDKCEPQTEYKYYTERFSEKPEVIPNEPLKNLALVIGAGTVSKSDSVAALFRAHDIGPIIGTPSMASSGRYYFNKEYQTEIEGKIITLETTFTPDFSVDGACAEIQANPVLPHVLVPHILENNPYYDTQLWIEAAKALQTWDKEIHLERKCSIEDTQNVLKTFGLE